MKSYTVVMVVTAPLSRDVHEAIDAFDAHIKKRGGRGVAHAKINPKPAKVG